MKSEQQIRERIIRLGQQLRKAKSESTCERIAVEITALDWVLRDDPPAPSEPGKEKL